MLGGAVVNAVAFSGSNYLFQKLGQEDSGAEQKRHNLAAEQFQRAQAEWNQKRTQRIDFINEELRREGEAVQAFRDGDEAMRLYYQVTHKKLAPIEREPRFSDFYTPSEAQKNREITFIVLGTAASALLAYKFL